MRTTNIFLIQFFNLIDCFHYNIHFVHYRKLLNIAMRDARARDRKVRYYTRFECEKQRPPQWTDYAENGKLLYGENDECVKICDKETDVTRIYKLWLPFMKEVTDAAIKANAAYQQLCDKPQSQKKVMNVAGAGRGSRKKRKRMITREGDDDDV